MILIRSRDSREHVEIGAPTPEAVSAG